MRREQSFEEHVAQVVKLTRQRADPTTQGRFQFYVIAKSAPKMLRRIQAKKHQFVYEDIVKYPVAVLMWNKAFFAHQPNKFDIYFLAMLHSSRGAWIMQSIMDRLERYRRSHHTSTNNEHTPILTELDSCGPQTATDLFPHLMTVDPMTASGIYSQETYAEFHQLLRLLILGYKASVKKLSSLSRTNPREQDLRRRVIAVLFHQALLHQLAYSTAITNHFSMLAAKVLPQRENAQGVAEGISQDRVGNDGDDNNHKRSNSANTFENMDDDGEADDSEDADDGRDADGGENDNDDDLDDEDDDDEDDDDETERLNVAEALRQGGLANSYKVWLRLQVAYMDAIDTICSLPGGDDVTIKVFSTPSIHCQVRDWRSVIRDVMGPVLSPTIIKTIENMAADNAKFAKGLEQLSEHRTHARGHCEAGIAGLILASKGNLRSSGAIGGKGDKFSWEDIKVCLFFSRVL
jgi:hypothetical protein